MNALAGLRKLGELARAGDRRADLKYRSILSDLAAWEHAAGSYGADAVNYQMRRASWRLLILAGAL